VAVGNVCAMHHTYVSCLSLYLEYDVFSMIFFSYMLSSKNLLGKFIAFVSCFTRSNIDIGCLLENGKQTGLQFQPVRRVFAHEHWHVVTKCTYC